MERAVTYSDHSGTVTTRYFTRAAHKSYGPMTQLLPGPRCPNVTHVPTVLLQTSSPSLYPSPSHFAATPHPLPRRSLHPFMRSLPFDIRSLLHLSVYYFSHPYMSVCLSAPSARLSALSCLALSLSPPLPASLPNPISLVLRPRATYAQTGKPSSEPLRVLSASCRVRMDV